MVPCHQEEVVHHILEVEVHRPSLMVRQYHLVVEYFSAVEH